MYLFSYGSNHPAQLGTRLQRNLEYSPARLENYQRVFRGYSKTWQGGTASIEKMQGHTVYGLVYEVTDKDLKILDKYEGVANKVYKRVRLNCIFDIDDSGTSVCKPCEVYVCCSKEWAAPSLVYLMAIMKTIKAGWSMDSESISSIYNEYGKPNKNPVSINEISKEELAPLIKEKLWTVFGFDVDKEKFVSDEYSSQDKTIILSLAHAYMALKSKKNPISKKEFDKVKKLLLTGLSSGHKESEFDKEQLNIGTSIEMEHTKDQSIAKQIAMDHLVEDKDYYKKLLTFVEIKKNPSFEVPPRLRKVGYSTNDWGEFLRLPYTKKDKILNLASKGTSSQDISSKVAVSPVMAGIGIELYISGVRSRATNPVKIWPPVQSILFPVDSWTEGKAIDWLKRNNFKGRSVHETKQYLRFRQEDPDKFEPKSLRTYKEEKGIKTIRGHFKR